MLTDVRVSRLDNGVRVITSNLPHVASVTFGVWVGAGARHESAELSGVSHFIEHILFKGTKTRSARDISQGIEGSGGYLNAFTQEESTCYYARVAFDQLGPALDVLGDMYMNPAMRKDDVEKERGVILEEIMMYRDQPQHVVHEMLMEALWKDHPLGVPISGSPETLSGMTAAVLRRYKKQSYVPGNTVFAFAGKLEHDACVDRVAAITGKLRKARKPTFRKVTTKIRQDALTLADRDIEQTHLAIGVRLFGRVDERRYTLRILNAVLGENMSSRLFQIVREKHGLAYSVHSSLHMFRDTGVLLVNAGLDRSRHEKAIGLIFKELARLKNKPIGRAELKRAKDYVIGQTRLGLESTTHQMMWLGDNIISHGKFLAPDASIARLSAVTSSDIQQLAQSAIKRSRTSVAMVSPGLSATSKGALRSALRQL